MQRCVRCAADKPSCTLVHFSSGVVGLQVRAGGPKVITRRARTTPALDLWRRISALRASELHSPTRKTDSRLRHC